jgi:hypothetical protein
VELNPATNTWVDATPGGTLPPGRGWSGVTYESANSRLVLYGGFSVDSVPQLLQVDVPTCIDRQPRDLKALALFQEIEGVQNSVVLGGATHDFVTLAASRRRASWRNRAAGICTGRHEANTPSLRPVSGGGHGASPFRGGDGAEQWTSSPAHLVFRSP